MQTIIAQAALTIEPRRALEPILKPTAFGKALENARAVVEQKTEQFRQVMLAVVMAGLPASPGQLLALEAEAHAQVARKCIDPVVAEVLRMAHADPVVLERADALIANTPNLRSQNSVRRVNVTLRGGSEAAINTPYYLRRETKRFGRKRRRPGCREAEGNGVYPVLAALGIHYRATPALASEVARLVAMTTEAEAYETLRLRGIELSKRQVSRLAKRFANRGLKYRAWKQKQTQAGYRATCCLQGRRLVIGTDGGRLRLRETRNGKRGPSGRRPFDAPWREPKVLIVYEVDAQGRKLRNGLVRYDATMQDADGAFEILVSLLREIGAQEASEWIIVGDGAAWIWDRIPGLIQKVGYSADKVTEVVDFYHAVQRIQAIAEEKKDWSAKEREAWVEQCRGYLKRGQVDRVLDEANLLCRGRRSKRVSSLLNYFVNHADRMRYNLFRKRGIPLGSGAVESCVRRTINLRLKGNGIFWLKETAEGLMHMRAQMLSGRWNEHVAQVLEPEALWSLPFRTTSALSCSM